MTDSPEQATKEVWVNEYPDGRCFMYTTEDRAFIGLCSGGNTTRFREVMTDETPDEITRLRASLKRCSDELFGEVVANYPNYMLDYPHNQQRIKNDMESVVEARKLLGGDGDD